MPHPSDQPTSIVPGDPGHISHHKYLHGHMNDLKSPFREFGTIHGPLASRPAAGSVHAGARYYATDALRSFISDGVDWVQVLNSSDPGEDGRFSVGQDVAFASGQPWADITAAPYSADPSGVTDSTASIVAALVAARRVYVPAGTYSVTTGFALVSGTDLIFAVGATFKFAAGVAGKEMLHLTNVSNVLIQGGVLDGNVAANPTPAGGNFGITIRGGNHIRIVGTKATGFADQSASAGVGGDGFYIASSPTVPEHVTLVDCEADGCGRNGFTIIAGKDVKLVRPRAVNTGGNNPGAGVIVEPDVPGDSCTGIRIIDPYTRNNYRGVNVSIAALTAASEAVDILVTGHQSHEETSWGMVVGQFVGASSPGGVIRFSDCYVRRSTRSGIYVFNYEATGPHLIFERPVIDSCGSGAPGGDSPEEDSGIVFSNLSTDAGTGKLGNCDIINPTIFDTRAPSQTYQAWYVNDRRSTPVGVTRVQILDPLRVEGLARDLGGLNDVSKTGDIRVSDRYEQVTRDEDLSEGITANSMAHKYTSSSYTGNHIQTLPRSGNDITFQQTQDSNRITVVPELAQKIVPTSTGPGKYIQSVTKGSLVRLHRVGDFWYVEELIGTWNAEP